MSQMPENLFERLKRDRRYEKLRSEYQQLMIDYTNYMIRQQLAYQTVRRGFYMAGKFLAFLEKIGVYEITSVTIDIMNTFLSTIVREGTQIGAHISVSYLTDYHIHVKKLFNSLFEEKRILINPAEKIKLPQQEDVIPRNILTRDEIQKLLALPDKGTLSGIRDRAIFELLYGCGLRNSELRNLRMDDADLKGGQIHIRESKGAKDRIVPMGRNAAFWLERYINLRRGLRPDLKEIFLSDIFNRPISQSYLIATVRRYAIKANIGKKITPHSFRHTYATHLLSEGAGLRHIQALLGHSTLNSTQVYTHVTIPEIKNAHSLLHPRDKLDLLADREDLTRSRFIRKIGPRRPRRTSTGSVQRRKKHESKRA